MAQENPVTKLLDKVDNYIQTVGAIVSLGHIFIYDFKGKYKIAPKFQTSPSNRISKSTEVTPDVAGQTDTMSLVGEVKKDFPENQEYWDDDIKQLEKYDDVLSGWPVRPTSNHDIVLLTHYNMSRRVQKYIQEQITKANLRFDRPFIILEFVRQRDRSEYWSLAKARGNLSDKTLDAMLENPLGVAGDDIVPELSSVKFYDHEPPVVYTMSLLWDFVFPDKAPPEKFREAEGRKTIEITFTIDEAHKKLRDFYGPPDSAIPRRRWIANAMKGLERIGLAYKSGEMFIITYHRVPEGQILKYFAEQWVEKELVQTNVTGDGYFETVPDLA
jgi:hypothetical protein